MPAPEVLSLLREVIVALVAAGAVYGGIRADLRHAIRTAEGAVTAAGEAHRRIDNVLLGGK
jgi:hypothetical protein